MRGPSVSRLFYLIHLTNKLVFLCLYVHDVVLFPVKFTFATVLSIRPGVILLINGYHV